MYPTLFAAGLEVILGMIIIYQVIPFFPFDGMDGARVLNYSKILYAIGALLSLLAIICTARASMTICHLLYPWPAESF